MPTPPGFRSAENETFVATIKGRMTERALRGNCFTATLPATTTGIAAGNLVGAGGAASTQFAVWNPAGSGKNLALLQLWIGLISGTPAGGPLFHCMSPTAPNIASVGTIQNAMQGNAVATVARCALSAAGATLTAGGALSTIRPTSLYFSATAFAGQGSLGMEDIGGSLIIPQGYLWVPCWSAVGTSVLNAYGAMWEEIPV